MEQITPLDDGPPFLYRCDCGEKFWVDPCTEENLFFNGKVLIATCPNCGKHECS